MFFIIIYAQIRKETHTMRNTEHKETYLKQVGKVVRQLRRELNLTQSELARRAGLYDSSTISKIERGETDMTLSTVAKVSNALGVSPDVIFAAKMVDFTFPSAELDEATRKEEIKEPDDILSKLSKLIEYYKEGLISQDEYNRTKERLLK